MLAVLLVPWLVLGPCLVGARTFVPYDVAQWPPVATALTDRELAEVQRAQNTDPTEIPLVFLPELRFAAQELREGRLPEWNPYARGGAPLLATSVVGLLYPPNWLCFVTGDPARALAFVAYVTLATAGLLMLGWLRALGVGLAAAVFGAIAFQLSGTLYANAHFYQRLSALVWLPGMLWALHVIATRRGTARLPATAALALCTAMTWLAGFPSYAAPVTLVTGLIALCYAARALRADGARAAAAFGPTALAGVGLGFALAAVQLAPMFAFFPESNRSVSPGRDELALQGFDPAGLLGYVFPDLFGHPHTTSALPYGASPLAALLFTRADWDTGKPFWPLGYNFVEYTVFPGTLVLLLAVAAVLHRGARIRGALLAALLALLALSLGSAWLAALHELPGLRNVPPKRFVGPACALVAALAALGFDAALRGLGRRRALALSGGALVLGMACLGAWLGLRERDAQSLWSEERAVLLARWQRWLPQLDDATLDEQIGRWAPAAHAQLVDNLGYAGIWLVLGALWVWMVASAHGRRRAVLLGAGIAATALQLALLASAVSGGRVLRHPIDTPVHAFLRAQRDLHRDAGGFTVARADRAPELPYLLPPCTLVPERIRDLNIYTFVDGRSHLPFAHFSPGPDQLLLEHWIECLVDGPDLQRPLLDLLGVRFLLSDQPLAHAGPPVGPPWSGPQGSFYVYERDTALPRAFVVPAVETLPDDAAVAEALARPGFAPLRAALLTPEEAARLPPMPAPDPAASARAVHFARDDTTDLLLRVDDGPAGYLVITDTYMSGWSAMLDDAPSVMVRGDLCYRVLPLPPGKQEVRLRYRTPRLALGAVVTGAALLVLLALLGIALARAPGRGRAPASEYHPPPP